MAGLAILLAVPFLSGAGCNGKKASRFPDANVLIITVDTLRADHLGCYGYQRQTSPALDGFAGEGILFESALTPRPSTGPALTSLLTGLYPYRHGVRSNRVPIGDFPTLPGILRDRGFATAAFVSNYVLKSKFCGFDKYFDLYDDEFSLPELNRKTVLQALAGDVTGKAVTWLEENGRSRFFLWVHYMDPHGPYRPPENFRSVFSHEERDLRPARVIRGYQQLPEAYHEGDFVDVNDYVDQYDNEIYYADLHIGKLLAKVKDLGLDEKTLVVFTSDHGESLVEHGYYFDHGKRLYDSSCRIPLIMRFPGSKEHAGGRVESLVSLMDLFPTVLDILGMEWKGFGLDGVSLLPLLGGAPSVREDVFLEFVRKDRMRRAAVRSRKRKIIDNGKVRECYDLLKDPAEEDPEECDGTAYRELKMKLENFGKIAGESITVSRETPLEAPDREVLRSLGYVR